MRSDCTITIAGLNCRDTKNESPIFSDTDSLFWTKDNEIVKKDKIELKRVKAQGDEYETDSLYVFKFAKDERTYFPYDIRHDSLIVQSTISTYDAEGQMILTK